MPVRNGPTCNEEVPWRATSNALQMQGVNVKFSIDKAYDSLNKVLRESKFWNLKPSKKIAVFKNLCTSCWKKQSAMCGDASTYEAARVKTAPDAMYFQVVSSDSKV